jgi:hypothetical protein
MVDLMGVLSAVAEMEVGADGDSIVDALAGLDRLQAKIAVAVGEFEHSGEWALDGATSATAWLRQNASLSSGQAAWSVRVGRRMRQFPHTAAAWADGRLSGGHVQAIVTNVADDTAPLFAEQEEALLPHLAPLSVSDAGIAMQRWREGAEDQVERTQRPERVRQLFLSKTLGGRGELRGSFDAESRSILETAMRLAATDDAAGEERSPAQRRADALVDVARHFLDHQSSKTGGRHRPHLNVVVRADQGVVPVGSLIDGSVLPLSTIQRLLCDCAAHRVLVDADSTILDYGRAARTAPVNLFNALVVRDQHCRHAGCDRPPEWCEAHHVKHWENGGHTRRANVDDPPTRITPSNPSRLSGTTPHASAQELPMRRR